MGAEKSLSPGDAATPCGECLVVLRLLVLSLSSCRVGQHIVLFSRHVLRALSGWSSYGGCAMEMMAAEKLEKQVSCLETV